MALMPHCPTAPDDVDPAIIAIQQNRDPPTVEDYQAWVRTMGNKCTGIEKVKEIFTDKKIENWFEEQGGSVLCKITPDPITFDLCQACARKHPPSNFTCPGIDVMTAQAIILTVQCLIFVKNTTTAEMSQCAACGKEGDSLKICTACRLVKYCNVACQKAHRKNHKRECKKRAAEIFEKV
eukprot:CAMPEP_0172303550 /NCGR_PEP_ID=MMETSP1058-20130122/5081_1 /TAXON_ID=83371 /ORGANISM="Detonula confervacea, Strain CCMP 353" /LENGTH=179 /DNA_ID=CAMNT_0013014413 /DNA_START=179 /DNA_END=718 /DNA_ORIENTATION=+